MNTSIPSPLLIRRSQLKNTVGLAPSTVDRLERAGDFPKRRRCGPGVVGWLATEVQAWLNNREQVG